MLPEFVWAVLDCPTYFALYMDGELPLSMLARLSARIDAPIAAGEEHVVIAWPIELDGRKRHAGAARAFGGRRGPRGRPSAADRAARRVALTAALADRRAATVSRRPRRGRPRRRGGGRSRSSRPGVPARAAAPAARRSSRPSSTRVALVELLGLVELRVAEPRGVHAQPADAAQRRLAGETHGDVVGMGAVDDEEGRGSAGGGVDLLDRFGDADAAGQAPVRLDGEAGDDRQAGRRRGASRSPRPPRDRSSSAP